VVGSIKARLRLRLVGRHQAKPFRILSVEGNSQTSVVTRDSKVQRLEILLGLLLRLLRQTLRPSVQRHLSLLSLAAALHLVLRHSGLLRLLLRPVLAALHRVHHRSVVTRLHRLLLLEMLPPRRPLLMEEVEPRPLLTSEIPQRLHLHLLGALQQPLHQVSLECLLRPLSAALRLRRVLPRLVVALLPHLLRLVARVLKPHLRLGAQHQVNLPSVAQQRLLPRLSVFKHLVLHQWLVPVHRHLAVLRRDLLGLRQPPPLLEARQLLPRLLLGIRLRLTGQLHRLLRSAEAACRLLHLSGPQMVRLLVRRGLISNLQLTAPVETRVRAKNLASFSLKVDAGSAISASSPMTPHRDRVDTITDKHFESLWWFKKG
jgi:hypothetical protein